MRGTPLGVDPLRPAAAISVVWDTVSSCDGRDVAVNGGEKYSVFPYYRSARSELSGLVIVPTNFPPKVKPTGPYFVIN